MNYELWDKRNLILAPKAPGMIQHEYLREALKNGLKAEQDLGINPFKYGMAGGSDAHNGLTAVEEDKYFSKFATAEPRPDRWDEDARTFGGRVIKGWELSAAGYTAVWVTGNSRAELWDAMKRRETDAISGPRMVVRFFGGFDFTPADVSRLPALVGFAKGVPMGGDLKTAPAGTAPTFLVAALKDARGGNLDRIQIIKGWLDTRGKPQERIYDVVWGDASRRRIVNGRLTPVGSTADVATASWDQHDRRPRTHRRVEGSGCRPGRARPSPRRSGTRRSGDVEGGAMMSLPACLSDGADAIHASHS